MKKDLEKIIDNNMIVTENYHQTKNRLKKDLGEINKEPSLTRPEFAMSIQDRIEANTTDKTQYLYDEKSPKLIDKNRATFDKASQMRLANEDLERLEKEKIKIDKKLEEHKEKHKQEIIEYRRQKEEEEIQQLKNLQKKYQSKDLTGKATETAKQDVE